LNKRGVQLDTYDFDSVKKHLKTEEYYVDSPPADKSNLKKTTNEFNNLNMNLPLSNLTKGVSSITITSEQSESNENRNNNFGFDEEDVEDIEDEEDYFVGIPD
jgi:hypothetical protein